MSILGIQRKYAESFRIRLGQKNGNAPASLKGEIRITSKSKEWCQAFADLYGGRPKRWEDKGYEVILPTNRLPITILPGQNLNQNMEHWTSGGCERRCDSVTMSDGSPCKCDTSKPISDRLCKPTSRLTVACPEVGLAGTGMLTTRSAIAAEEWAGAFSLIQPMLDQRQTVDAVLRIDAMATPGHHFNVPRIELKGITFADLEAAAELPALGSAPTPQLTTTTTQGE